MKLVVKIVSVSVSVSVFLCQSVSLSVSVCLSLSLLSLSLVSPVNQGIEESYLRESNQDAGKTVYNFLKIKNLS